MTNRLVRLTLGIWLGVLCLAACAAPAAPLAAPSALAKEIVLGNWADDIPQSVLDAFEQEFGTHVRSVAYESQETAIAEIRAGYTYDLLTMESRFVPALVADKLVAPIDYHNVPNFKNISANFRDLMYDPQNKYSVPFNWGTTGLVVRRDLLREPVAHWAALFDARYRGKVAIWMGQPREVIALTLKSLGYSANSENPAELDAALKRMLTLQPDVLFLEDYDPVDSSQLMASGKAVIAMGYALDALSGRKLNPAIDYVLPDEGALLWGDNFVMPANSPYRATAEALLNFLMRPDINAQIANHNQYATANEAARKFIAPAILNEPIIFPRDQDVKQAEIILPLSPAGQKRYDTVWENFIAARK